MDILTSVAAFAAGALVTWLSLRRPRRDERGNPTSQAWVALAQGLDESPMKSFAELSEGDAARAALFSLQRAVKIAEAKKPMLASHIRAAANDMADTIHAASTDAATKTANG